jgi:hypothetical protein
LLERGLEGHLILLLAAVDNRIDILDLLVEEHGVDVNTPIRYKENSWSTILTEVAQEGIVKAVDWLIQHGADLEAAANNNSYTPLWGACGAGYLRVARILLEAGANPNCVRTRTGSSSTGSSALCVCAQDGKMALAAELLHFGADPNLTHKPKLPAMPVKMTPLIVALCNGHLEMVAMLMNAGAEMILRDCVTVLKKIELKGETVLPPSQRKLTQRQIKQLKALTTGFAVPHLLAADQGKSVVSEHYAAAQEAERKRDYRTALRHVAIAESSLQQFLGKPPLPFNDQVVSAEWTQLLLDEQRLCTALYGVEHSDGRVSAWERHIFTEGHNSFPPNVLFYAWARHGDLVYRHGGHDFTKQEQYPSLDCLWALDLNTKVWSEIKTKGRSPGPRTKHVAVVYGNAFYVLGGVGRGGPADMSLYRLDMSTHQWTQIKAKGGTKPERRGESGGFVYKDQLFIYGGESDYTMGDLWSYSFQSQKWKLLSASGGTPRKSHQMWIARDKLYMYGGEQTPVSASSVYEARSIRAFEYFDLKERTWNQLRCAGDDPWELSESCSLPLYYGQEEPSAVLIWGGYCATGNGAFEMDGRKNHAKYGDEYMQFGLPYRKRLLRLDLDTHVFTSLKPMLNTLNPLAQCFAAEMSTENGVTNIIIGEGYGMSPNSKDASIDFPDEIRQSYEDSGGQLGDKGIRPSVNHGLYKVMIHDHREASAADKAATGIGWEWEFASIKGDQRPETAFSLHVGSPIFHWQQFFHEDDFRNPPSGDIQDNDEATNLGRRLILHSLNKADLNGSLGRCGPWLEDTERYHVLLCDEGGSPKRQLSVRSANLRYDTAVDDVLLMQKCMSTPLHIGPLQVQPFWLRSGTRSKRSPLEDLLDNRVDGGLTNLSLAHDTYNGPLSAKARAVVEYVGVRESSSDSQFSISLESITTPSKTGSNVKREYFRKFIESQRLADQARVDSWQKSILSSRDTGKWKDFLRLKVSIDGLKPAVWRELLVSPFVTIERLYKQVLCPAVGWTSNLHAYALRRFTVHKGGSDVLEGLEQECWIAATFSTALDVIHRPFYIGGAVVDDREILLGDLFYSSKNDTCMLQWVHDLGDWWSHTIDVSEDLSQQQAETSAAVLLSGSGACPPEGTGGVAQYCQTLLKLNGTTRVDGDQQGGGYLDPSSSSWWELVNDNLRGKENTRGLHNPFAFHIKFHQEELAGALVRRVKRGGEDRFVVSSGFDTGLQGTNMTKPQVHKKENDPTKFCALCGTTAALMVCSGCKSVAFCGRAHQVECWPKHKAQCKATQKNAKTGQSKRK